MRSLFVFLIVAVATVLPTTAQSVLDDELVQRMGEEGLAYLYNMKFERADSVFSLIDARYPGHPIGPFLQGLITWWKILPELSSGDESHDAAFFEKMEEVNRRADRMIDGEGESLDAMLFKAAALGFRGRLRSNRQKWLGAANDGRGALDYVFRVAEADPENADFMFGKGVYDYFAETIPERYPIVRPMMFFFPDGDRQRGIEELKFTADEGRFIRTEAAYFLFQIYFIYEPSYREAVEYIQWLRTRYPDNAYFHILEGRVYSRWAQWNLAVPVLTDVLDRYSRGATGYSISIAQQAHYYMGRRHMLAGEYDISLDSFGTVSSLGRSSGGSSNFEVLALLRTGMIHDLQGRRAEAIEAYRAALKLPDLSDAHSQARRYLDAPYHLD